MKANTKSSLFRVAIAAVLLLVVVVVLPGSCHGVVRPLDCYGDCMDRCFERPLICSPHCHSECGQDVTSHSKKNDMMLVISTNHKGTAFPKAA
ncbi:unnamed protein product [Linum tenue]|uniref:Uncharacterized protein n=1 Tax=Linum tenue TaxID=586396 RepID=A0AAV0MYC6_9ROSI|nr:unnamed protein product [Linum tenue]